MGHGRLQWKNVNCGIFLNFPGKDELCRADEFESAVAKPVRILEDENW
jgi:hypothetical protein